MIRPGDIVAPAETGSKILLCGNESYDKAIVVSTKPLVLVSLDYGMLWHETTFLERLRLVGVGTEEQLVKAREKAKRHGL